jgi:prepilin-type N-terminal cleavage/methylation domain-containing protein
MAIPRCLLVVCAAPSNRYLLQVRSSIRLLAECACHPSASLFQLALVKGAPMSPRPYPPRRRPGFTLIELLVVVAIIAVLIAILLPSLGRAKQNARRVQCAAVLRSWGQGVQLYSQQNDNWIQGKDGSIGWAISGGPYSSQFGNKSQGDKMRTCPGDPAIVPGQVSYLFTRFNPKGATMWKMDSIKGPGSKMLMCDAYNNAQNNFVSEIQRPGNSSLPTMLIALGGTGAQFNAKTDIENRHGPNGGNVSFYDYHVEAASWGDYLANIPNQPWSATGPMPGDETKKWTVAGE